ncbi:MAG: EamA family transporter RarD [Clostridia bacterium]|nr:EamA family transporter RarD [Clostridia bacterium]
MEKKNYVEGLVMGALAFTLWGLLPLYWKLVKAISPYQIFAHRVVWSLLFVLIILSARQKLPEYKRIVMEPKNWIGILGPAFFISINWLLYIWAVNNDYVIESSLGYFINPLVLTLFGAIFYRERLNKLQLIGIGLATTGVILKSFSYGRVPYIALVLAISFAIYGLLKKKSNLDSLNGLGFETLVIGIPSLIYLTFTELHGNGLAGNLPTHYWFLIALSGVATATPLLLYAEGTKRLPLSVIGFLQYISPSIMLVLGVFVFKEPFLKSDLGPFVLIWVGLLFFSYSQYKLLSLKSPVKS